MDFKIGLGGGGDGPSGASSNNASSCSDDDNAPSAKIARTTTTTATNQQQQQAQSFHQLMMLREQQRQCCSPTDSTAASSGQDSLLAARPLHQQMLPPPAPASHSLSQLEHQQGGVASYQYKQTGCGGMQLAMSLHEATLGPRYPFTAVQWAELEHQALVFKYMMARVPPPPELIAPIRKSVAAVQGLFHTGSATTAIGGTHVHHLDLEPGRCRRTDGKKWRCARPIVPDQKYCERHINRGKHKRSSKNSNANNNNNDNNANRSMNSINQQRSTSQPVAVGGGALVAVEPLQSRFSVASTTNSSSSGQTTFGVGQQPTTMASVLSQQMRSFSNVNGSHQQLLQQQRQQQLYMATPNLSSKDRFLSGPVCSEQLLFSEVSGSSKQQAGVATAGYMRSQATTAQSQYYYESRTPTSTTTTEEGDAFYVSSGSSSFLQQRDRQQHYLASSQQQQGDVKRLKPLFKEWPSTTTTTTTTTSSSNSDEKDNKVKCESVVNLSMSNGGCSRDEQDYTSALGGPLAEALHKTGGEQRQRSSSDDKPTAFWLSNVR